MVALVLTFSAWSCWPLVLSLGFSVVRLRQWLMPEGWRSSDLVEAILGVALLIWLSEAVGRGEFSSTRHLVISSTLLSAATLRPRVRSAALPHVLGQLLRSALPLWGNPATRATRGRTLSAGGGADLGDHPEGATHRRGVVPNRDRTRRPRSYV